MSQNAECRRMKLLDILAESEEPRELSDLSVSLGCDERTIRRDLDHLQNIMQRISGLEVRRGKALVARSGYSPGYFTHQLDRNTIAKQQIAQSVVRLLPDDMAIALTAGSTTFAVAREIRKASVEGISPNNLIVFTNSVPSLLELIAAGVATGVLGEIYNHDDCAFHSPETRSSFQPGIAIVGASGVLFGNDSPTNGLDLFSHRSEEAAFLKQLLANVPEIIVTVDNNKLGKRHPWSFGGSILQGKKVHLVTDFLSEAQSERLDLLKEKLPNIGIQFQVTAANQHSTLSEQSKL